ncbi:MAG: TetR/AcrR family transcriptional regulator [Meiothermus sp.]
MTVKPRLTHRQRQAQATQQLIIKAAEKLFLDVGYGVATIEAIAERAGVAVSTVYAVFGSKRGILKAIREAWHQVSQAKDILQQASKEPDSKRRVEIAAHATRRQWEASATMMAIYNSAAAVDPEAAAELKAARTGRRTHLGHVLEGWVSSFRPGLDPKRAVALYNALTLPEVYLELVREYGWTPDEYENWLAETLKQQLL